MDETARAWSIGALCLLCALLAYVLLRTPPEVRPAATQRAHAAPSVPVAPQPSGGFEPDPEMYRGWPLFLGWPLPEVPSGWGTGGSQPAPSEPAPPPVPPHRPREAP
ncbi:hypothetical protein NR798_26535 [Archangium gephyra]|uniref:hypothetical protein n=1 Tax=Archangium gephyra TaxID=48 RepID=UPI0035D49178